MRVAVGRGACLLFFASLLQHAQLLHAALKCLFHQVGCIVLLAGRAEHVRGRRHQKVGVIQRRFVGLFALQATSVRL